MAHPRHLATIWRRLADGRFASLSGSAGYEAGGPSSHDERACATAHHVVGTCRMGRSAAEGAVLDPQLRVFGVSGLRVIDASVIPDLVGGNINAAVYMIAERASDLVRGRTPLARARSSFLSTTAVGPIDSEVDLDTCATIP